MSPAARASRASRSHGRIRRFTWTGSTRTRRRSPPPSATSRAAGSRIACSTAFPSAWSARARPEPARSCGPPPSVAMRTRPVSRASRCSRSRTTSTASTDWSRSRERASPPCRQARELRRGLRAKIVAYYNGNKIQVGKVKGEFVWHSHPDTDDFFLVLKGHLTIQLRERDVELGPGDLFVVPRGVEHCPRADDEAHILLIEP